ncbi:hypothetical protein BJY52DRAFT_198816 [Lactarius psammicola]|nr:hypothetical protein BJY52DRAFT_198816 [Lactarius psammicola]
MGKLSTRMTWFLSFVALLASVVAYAPSKREVDPTLIPRFGWSAGINPTGTGKCDSSSSCLSATYCQCQRWLRHQQPFESIWCGYRMPNRISHVFSSAGGVARWATDSERPASAFYCFRKDISD